VKEWQNPSFEIEYCAAPFHNSLQREAIVGIDNLRMRVESSCLLDSPEHLLEKSNALGITSLSQEGAIEVLTVIDVYELGLELISRVFVSAKKDMLH
jgi:hypothetical protein